MTLAELRCAAGPAGRGAARTRLAAALLVLAGVLAMHALTIGHSPAMAAPGHLTSAQAAGAHDAMGDVMAAARDVAGQVGDPVAATVAPQGTSGGSDCGGCQHAGHLADACVAVLGVGLALFLLLVAMQRGRGTMVLTPAAVRVARLSSLSTAMRPPSLAQLCVLRT